MVRKNFRSMNEAIHDIMKNEPASFYVRMKTNIKSYVDKEFQKFIEEKNISKNNEQFTFYIQDFTEFNKKLNGDIVADFK